MLREGVWGKGYATEAATALLALCFGDFDAPNVVGQTSAGNVPSWRVMQRLGMIRRADLDYDDPDYPVADNPTMVWDLTATYWHARIRP